MANFVIDIVNEADGVIVTMRGHGDMVGTQMLEQKLLALSAIRPARVVFDLAGLESISSIFMGALVRFRNGLVSQGKKVVLARPQPLVLTALKRAQLDRLMTITDSIEAVSTPAQPAQPPAR